MASQRECPRPHHLNMFDPVRCVIQVQGALERSWSERLGGLAIAVYETSGGPCTFLTGTLPDQAALLGILTALYDLGLPLLSVTAA